MIRGWNTVRFAALALVLGCGGSRVVGGGSGGAGGNGVGGDAGTDAMDVSPSPDVGPDRGGDSVGDGQGQGDVGPDAGVCCPLDSVMTGCMHVGGYSTTGCSVWCDFFCSTNWRIENDPHGCPVWRWDQRAPAPGEDRYCFSAPDAGTHADAHADAMSSPD